MSAFCGNTLEMQNCRESPSVLKFLPAKNRTGLPCSQRSKAEDEECCRQWGRHGKGHGPKRGAASPGTSSQLWSCNWESLSACIVQTVISFTQHTACSALWSFSNGAELACPWNPVEKSGPACHCAGVASRTALPAHLQLCWSIYHMVAVCMCVCALTGVCTQTCPALNACLCQSCPCLYARLHAK